MHKDAANHSLVANKDSADPQVARLAGVLQVDLLEGVQLVAQDGGPLAACLQKPRETVSPFLDEEIAASNSM